MVEDCFVHIMSKLVLAIKDEDTNATYDSRVVSWNRNVDAPG